MAEVPLVQIREPSRSPNHVAKGVYFECPKCSHRSRNVGYVIDAEKRTYLCPNCGARVDRTEKLARIFFAMLVYGLVLLLIELLVDPSARLPSLFDASAWNSVLWLAILFAALVALTWCWFMRWCFRWELLEERSTGTHGAHSKQN